GLIQAGLIVVALGLLAGCAPWTVVGGPYQDSDLGFTVDLPHGWHKSNMAKDMLVITRDGLALDLITIGREDIEKKEEEGGAIKRLTKGMLPQEASDVIADRIRSDTSLMNVQLLENIPADIGGQKGYRLTYSYRTASGLPKKVVSYGFLLGKWLYSISYEAPVRHYFDAYFSVFEKVKGSFSVGGTEE
ncbi:MAG: hypothetical protein OEV28_08135, partial [Nitrospirota bacterium]|nr:hypothetical protein [Nitrospirota bacterium]